MINPFREVVSWKAAFSFWASGLPWKLAADFLANKFLD